MKKNHKSVIQALTLLGVHAPIWAHDGHGLFGSHWHASDATGFLVAIGLVIAAWAVGRGK